MQCGERPLICYVNARHGVQHHPEMGVLDFDTRVCSPEAQAWNLAMFGNNRFFAFCISYRGIDEILPEWELASGLAFSESKMAALKSISIYL